ncbi:unnamed protein product [Angiostrongylus costaricensis]|uniref:Serpentine receptor class gamma n=1 Tax=Angiostrongylus costaricensis TaxID=334426 RepID=A0A158PKG2_ANGCS|nr:unnamed protein product [Angiostrongylus costaricensis]
MAVDCKVLTAAGNIMISGIYFYHVVMYSVTTILVLYRKDTFHPFFCVLLAFFCLSYALSDFLEMFCTSVQLFGNVEDNVVRIIKKLGELFYVYASPCAILLVVERVVATLYSVQYEQLRPWSLFWIGQVFCVIFAFLVVFCQYWIEFNYNIQQWALLAIQLAILSLRACAEALIPISILVLHPCFKKMINISFRWCQIGKFFCKNKRDSGTMIGGVQISDIYFNNLRVMWNK